MPESFYLKKGLTFYKKATMAFVVGCFLRNQRFVFSSSLKRNFLISKAHLPGAPCRVSCPRKTNSTGPALLQINVRNLSYLSVHKRCFPPELVRASRGAQIHTSAQRRAVPAPLLWMVLKPLQKLLAIILGRSLRKWWVALPANRRQLLRDWLWLWRWRLVAGAAVALSVIAVLLFTHLDESPLTGRTRLLVFSKENYMELATLMSNEYMEEFAPLMLSESDPRHQVVERVIQHLAQRNKDVSEISEIDWSVHVVQDSKVNAFVLPNGKVFVFTGMLEAVADVHQLTIVLGHEMAHALLGHSAEQASLSHVVDLLSLILLTAVWAVCPRDSLALLGQWAQGKLTQLMFSRPYSRKLEAEADEVGLQLAAKACADVRAGPVFWQQMEMRDQLQGEPELPEWLSTHPSHKNRYTQLDRLMPQALELRSNCVCPALPQSDPRAVFSASVRLILENAKNQTRSKSEGDLLRPRSRSSPVPSALSLAADQENKVLISDNPRSSSQVALDGADGDVLKSRS